jgi:toxin CcdB
LVLDCQSDLLSALATRFVVPLIAHEGKQAATERLNPMFVINGQQYVMATHLAAAVQAGLIGERVASLRDRSFEVIGALDVLVSGV